MGIILSSLMACEKTDEPKVTPENPRPPETTMVSVNEVLNLTPDFIGTLSGAESGQNCEVGETLTLELTSGEILSDGFYAGLMEHIHIHVGDKVYMPEFPADEGEYVQKLSVKVTVPDEPFDIVAAYAVQQQLTPDGYTMRLEDNGDGIKLYGVSPEHKYKYFDCYLHTPDAYTIDKVEFKMGDGDWQDVSSVPGCNFARTELIDWVYRIEIRPDLQNVTGDVTLRVTGSQHGRYHIKWINTEYINTDIPEDWLPNVLPEEAIDGEMVEAQFYTKEGYYLKDVASNMEALELQCFSRSAVLFEMPASDVEITLNFKKKADVSYKGGSHISSAEIYDAKDIYYGRPASNGIPGEAVYLFANAEDGYKPSKAYVSGNGYDFVFYGPDRYQYYAEVILPQNDGPFEITADATKGYTVSTDGNFILSGGYFYTEGETVPFQTTAPIGKTLSGVTAMGADGHEVECTLENTYGSFIMPACDVTLTASYTDIDSEKIVHISAIYDSDEYSVYSQTDPYYQEITANGFDVPAGTTLYVDIQEYYGNMFWVGVKIGETVTYYEAMMDPDFGDVSFGKSFIFTDDTVIKVGATKDSVQFDTYSDVSVKADFDADEFIVRSSTNFDWDFAEGFTVPSGNSFYMTVQNMYGDPFWVGIKVGDQFNAYRATADDDTGEYTFGKSIQADDDVFIKVGYSSDDVTM